MEHDDEGIELQFVAGQPPLRHYCKARRPFKEFKVRLREWLQFCSLSLLECVSLPSTHHLRCWESGGWTKQTVVVFGLAWVKSSNEKWRTVGNECQSHYWQHPFSLRKKKNRIYRSEECGGLGLYRPPHSLIQLKETIEATSGLLFAPSRINFCHIIKEPLTAVGSFTIPPTKPKKLLTKPQWWILTSSLRSPEHLHSTDSKYTQCVDPVCKFSSTVLSRCCWCLSVIFIFTLFFSLAARNRWFVGSLSSIMIDLYFA